MDKKLQELKNILSEVYDLEKIDALLWWDQATYMPSGGAAARGRQMAVLATLAQEKFTDPAIGKLLERGDLLLDLWQYLRRPLHGVHPAER